MVPECMFASARTGGVLWGRVWCNAKRAEECGGMDKRGKRAPRQRNKPGTFKQQVRVCG